MKFRNILLAGLAATVMVSCSDYLDVDAPSKTLPEEVYSDMREANRALNGVYASMLTGDTYGSAFMNDFCYNTDVDFAMKTDRYANSSTYMRYECDPDAGGIKKVWDALYTGIERANMLINGLEKSPLYDEDDAEFMQMLGEATVLRAIFYHDLVFYFGDVPYTRTPAMDASSLIYEVADRTKILDDMIQDVIKMAPFMTQTTAAGFSDGNERISQEMAWAMIARMALTAGGYSLRPEGGKFGTMKRPDNYKEYYTLARDYAKKVMTESKHSLTKEFYEVFYAECNMTSASMTGDDIIFEIPFGKESTGSVGYIQGPKMDSSSGLTVHSWGKASSSAQLNAAYRFMFDSQDARRNYINQLFGYDQNGNANFNNGRTVYNGKWSKLWNAGGLGAATEGSTGINYPLMRYTDVLLMFAEAENELNEGPNAAAIAALEQVRERAFRNAPAKVAQPEKYADKETFLRAVLDERKFEFAGENMRWRDLVRNNMLAENVYWTFQRYYNLAMANSHYVDEISYYDFGEASRNIDADGNPILGEDGKQIKAKDWTNVWPGKIYYHNNYPYHNGENHPDDMKNNIAGYTIPFCDFPQNSPNMKVCWIINPYAPPTSADSKTTYNVDEETNGVVKKVTKNPGSADTSGWFDDAKGMPANYFLYSLRGYIMQDEDLGRIQINDNGTYVDAPTPAAVNVKTLPAVRYILPYPRAVITRSMGKYTNKYGYL